MKLNLPAPAAALELDAVMVDLDGTMVNTLGDFAEALNRMLADLQLPAIAPQIIENMVGKGSEHLIRSVLAHVEAPDIDALYPRAWQRYEHHYLTINGQFADVYPGVAEGLQALQSLGLRMACLTNKPCPLPSPAGRQGAGRLFRLRVRWRLLPAQSPTPCRWSKPARPWAANPRTLMVGDSSNDAQAAHAAGCPVVLMTYGYNHGQPITAVEARAHLDSLEQLVV
jgi:phosphoglycolate phosphatase